MTDNITSQNSDPSFRITLYKRRKQTVWSKGKEGVCIAVICVLLLFVYCCYLCIAVICVLLFFLL